MCISVLHNRSELHGHNINDEGIVFVIGRYIGTNKHTTNI